MKKCTLLTYFAFTISLIGCAVLVLMVSGCSLSTANQDLRNRERARNMAQATHAAVNKYGPRAESRLMPYFESAGVAYPPRNVAFLAFKNERRVELWAKNKDAWRFIRRYPLTAFSGTMGPKLRAHDHQIPEGIYHIGFLYPYSSWHLSMQIDYPNQYDLMQAKQEGRTSLGGDIFIHGRASSEGCLAVGDDAIEELFVLVAKTGTHAAKVIISPNDMRKHAPLIAKTPAWTQDLTQKISKELTAFQESSYLLTA